MIRTSVKHSVSDPSSLTSVTSLDVTEVIAAGYLADRWTIAPVSCEERLSS